jgi:4-hydroxy-tetrahydrodipicolinate reductase
MPTKLVVCGAAGRMGRTLVGLAAVDPELEIAGAIEMAGAPSVGQDAGEVAGRRPLGIPVTTDYAAAARPDTITLDFTNAEAALEHLRIAVANGAGIVVGATGFDPRQTQELGELAVRTRSVVAANMSVGINVLLKLVRAAASALGPGFDPEIVEIHHRMKVDSPSGTALALARAVTDELGRDLAKDGVYGREGIVGRRTDPEIGVMGLRGGDVIGDHTVFFLGTGERLELTHRAQSRDSLAVGALRAAKWLARQSQPGRYSMADVLGL